MMINALALCLILSSLATGVFFSPPQKKISNHDREDLIVKEANRVIMVEYERETLPRDSDNNSPPPSSSSEEPSLQRSMAYGVYDTTKKKLQEASSVLSDMGSHDDHHYNPKELICDAYGKCKNKLAGVFSKAKDGVEEVGEKTKETLGKAEDGVYEKAREMEEVGEATMEKTKEGFEKAKETQKEVGDAAMEKTKGGLEKAKEIGGETTMERAGEGFEKAKEGGKQAGEKTMENVKNLGQDVKRGHQALWDKRSAHTKATGLFKESVRNFTDLFYRGREVFYDAAKQSTSKEFMGPTMGVIQLLSLSTAYGISVWVTFLSSHVLAGILPRQQFGIVQSKIYPVYFKALVGSIATALIAHAFRNPNFGFKTFQTYNMIGSLALVLINLLYLEPLATKTVYDQMKLEKEEGRVRTAGQEEEVEEEAVCAIYRSTGAADDVSPTTTTDGGATSTPSEEEVRSRMAMLNRKLKTLNSISSLLNVMTLMAFTLQLFYVAADLPAPPVH